MSRTYRIPSTPIKASRIDYAAVLNEQQRQVVLAGGGPLLVIAGAGVGKTRTLTYRVARLLEAGVPAARLMLVTFTNRAAREMLQRVEGLLPGDPRRIWGGTFHSIGNRFLRRHAVSLGLRHERHLVWHVFLDDGREDGMRGDPVMLHEQTAVRAQASLR